MQKMDIDGNYYDVADESKPEIVPDTEANRFIRMVIDEIENQPDYEPNPLIAELKLYEESGFTYENGGYERRKALFQKLVDTGVIWKINSFHLITAKRMADVGEITIKIKENNE